MEKQEILKKILKGIKIERMTDPRFSKGGQIAGMIPIICIITHPDINLRIEIGEFRSTTENINLAKLLFELGVKEIFKL